MRIHAYGDEHAPVMIMLPGSFCNADTMADIITELKDEFHILAADYNGQYEGSEMSFTTNPCRKARVFRHGMNGTFSLSDYFLYWFCMYCITVSLLILPSVLI